MDLEKKTILLRADLNVPITNGIIKHTHRLNAIKPTIDLILKKNGTIFLATHLGRPTNNQPELSTKQLLPWFKKQGYLVSFAPTIIDAKQRGDKAKNQIILLENLRFFSGEKECDKLFAQQLASLGDIFVQDAFGALHRNDASIVLVPKLFDKKNRTIGLLIQQELIHLNKLIKPKHPFVLIVGGAKVFSKLSFILQLVKTWDTLLPCPAIVFALLKTLGKQIGNSLLDQKAIPLSKKLLEQATLHNKNIMMPTDYLVLSHNNNLHTTSTIKDNEMGISIGKQTVTTYKEKILEAETVFYTGLMGFLDQPKTLEPIKELFQAMAQSNTYSVIGGGDSVAAVEQLKINGIDWLSTGGGATLAYITGNPLPGLQPFLT